MKLKRLGNLAMVLLAMTLVLSLGACKKDPPAPPAPPVVDTPEPPAPEPVPEPPKPPIQDVVESPWSDDIMEANKMAREKGLLGDVFFDFDKSDLRDDARSRLSKNAEFMSGDGSKYTFTIEGHCDERGTNEYNLALGERRATISEDFMVDLGVAATRFKTLSLGEERPFCTESTEGCWQENRRARIVISGLAG